MAQCVRGLRGGRLLCTALRIPLLVSDTEVVLVPPGNTNLMRAGGLYESHCKLLNANTRIVVAWKVRFAVSLHIITCGALSMLLRAALQQVSGSA